MSLLAHWQPIAAGAVVALAVIYLVWKLGFEGRKPRRKRGPDVPVSRLVRKRPSRGCH
jgi:hypothetical protein